MCGELKAGKLEKEILPIFPDSFREKLREVLRRQDITEIRLRVGLPLILCTAGREYFFSKSRGLVYGRGQGDVLTEEEMKILFQKLCQYSTFAYKEELSEGFVTLKGGHRMGLCGKVFFDAKGKRQLQNITSMNLRIAHQMIGCGEKLFPHLIQDCVFHDTLLISPPGGGKTTYLRDLIRLLSDGTPDFPGQNVSVVDERSEIGNRTRESSGFYLGNRTDLLDHCPKAEGMLMLLRTMGPQIIAADEIGGLSDINALKYIRNCGCKILMTIHGKEMKDLLDRPHLGAYLKKYPFDRYVFLSMGKTSNRELDVFDRNQNHVWSSRGETE